MTIIKKSERIGQQITTCENEIVKIVDYINTFNVIIEFDDGYRKTVTYKNLKNGSVKKYSTKDLNELRLNEQMINIDGDTVKIIEYKNANNITCIIDDEKIYNVRYIRFKKGMIRKKEKQRKIVNNLIKSQKSLDKIKIGGINTNKNGLNMTVVEMLPGYRVELQFDDGFKKNNNDRKL